MSKIYSSFSNPSGDLSQLQHEFEGLFNFFNSSAIKKKVDYEFGMNATVDALTSKIIAGQKDIRLFHFSGHSGGSGLDFPKSQFTSEQISRFFNTICSDQSKIDCVFLNGCENEDIVNQLTRVPVVIGTRSKIEDHLASKFTLDFFNALIKSECSYQQAFNDAQSAIAPGTGPGDNTRGEGGSDEIENTGRLGEYFFRANDQRVAESKFPLKPKKKNWTKYLFLLFALIALLIGFLFKDKIFGKLSGYSCASIKPLDEHKCNFVIGDFSTIPEMADFSQWLYENIQEADVIKTYLNAININKFSNVIYDNSVHRDSLPSLCNYDFNLTGSLLHDEEGYVADFNIFPYTSHDHSLKSFSYPVKSLRSLDTLITTLNETNKTVFVLYNMCISCALNKKMPELPAILMAMVEKYNTSHETEAYQRMHSDLVDVNLHYGDTSSALISLDKISHAVGNDIALMAIERKIELFTNSNDIFHVFETQSNLMQEYQYRIQAPDKYNLSRDVIQYQTGENNVRLDRARLILKHKDGILKDYRQIALQDFNYLQSIKFPPGDFSKEISALQETTSDIPVQFHLHGFVYMENGKPLEAVTVSYQNHETITDENGHFDFGSSPMDAVGKTLYFTKNGFRDNSSIIRGGEPEKITMIAISEHQRVIFQAVRTDKELYNKIYLSLVKAGYGINKENSMNIDTLPNYFSQSSSVIYHEAASENQAALLARQLREWTNQNFELRFLPLKKSMHVNTAIVNNDFTIHFVGTQKMFQLTGRVFAKGDKPLYGAIVDFNGKKIKTDELGLFDFGTYPADQVIGMPLNVSRDKFTSVTLKINEENIRKIVLEPFKGLILNDHKLLVQPKIN